MNASIVHPGSACNDHKHIVHSSHSYRFIITGGTACLRHRLEQAFQQSGLLATCCNSVAATIRELVQAAHCSCPYKAIIFAAQDEGQELDWLRHALLQRPPIAHTRIFPVTENPPPDSGIISLDKAPASVLQALRNPSPGAPQTTRQPDVAHHTSHSILPNYNLNILLVEDDHFSQIVCKTLLQKLGCQVTVASDGKTAIDKYDQQTFDLILMDIRLPVMNGYETTRIIREREASLNRHTPIVALTANVLREDRDACQECGMDDFMGKPVSSSALRNVLERAAAPTTASGSRTKILLVEENRTRRREFLAEICASYPDASVLQAEQGIRACQIIFQQQPDIVVLNTSINGVEINQLLQHLYERKIDGNPVPEVVLLSVLESTNPRITEFRRLGVNHILQYPPPPGSLSKTVGTIFKNPGKEPWSGSFDFPANRTCLQNISDGEEALQTLFLERLRNTLPGDIDSLRQALRNGDFGSAGSIAHRLKSTAGYLGCHSFSNLSQRIENSCRHNAFDNHEARHLEREVEEQTSALMAILDQGKKE